MLRVQRTYRELVVRRALLLHFTFNAKRNAILRYSYERVNTIFMARVRHGQGTSKENACKQYCYESLKIKLVHSLVHEKTPRKENDDETREEFRRAYREF